MIACLASHVGKRRARMVIASPRFAQIVVVGLKSWLPEETRKELAKIEGYARGQVRVHHRMLTHFREQQFKPEVR